MEPWWAKEGGGEHLTCHCSTLGELQRVEMKFFLLADEIFYQQMESFFYEIFSFFLGDEIFFASRWNLFCRLMKSFFAGRWNLCRISAGGHRWTWDGVTRDKKVSNGERDNIVAGKKSAGDRDWCSAKKCPWHRLASKWQTGRGCMSQRNTRIREINFKELEK